MTSPVKLSRIHHVAYRCRDAKETVDWYARVLGMEYTTAFAEDHVPSTGEYDPYMHVFLDAGGGNVLAFFELPNQPEMGRDEKTPAWVQPSRSADNRSPLGTANATVTSGASGAAVARDVTSTSTSPERVRPSVSRAAAIVP